MNTFYFQLLGNNLENSLGKIQNKDRPVKQADRPLQMMDKGTYKERLVLACLGWLQVE